MEGANRPVAKRRPRIRDSRMADYNRPSYGSPFTEKTSYRQADLYSQEEEATEKKLSRTLSTPIMASSKP